MSKHPDSSPAGGFAGLGLAPALERGLRDAGFERPRPIQAETLPAALAGRDVLGLAQTGTGKTAAFGLPILQRMLEGRRPGPRALILAPSRELAAQIDAELRSLARHTRIASITVFGGVSAHAQTNALRRDPEIVVGCPGRVLDLLQRGVLRLDHVETLVLDEADHMFDMGFLPDVRRILSALPRRRQNLLFSATMPKELRRLADDLLHAPHVAELAHRGPAETVDHALYPVLEGRKRDLLDRFLGEEGCTTAIVFTRTKHRARRLADQLAKDGHKAIGLQGNMSQGQRERAMRGFRTGRYDVLVATDIAARGIDVSGVSHVINFDVPNTPEAYTHRIGRTGRSGLTGRACTFVTGDDGAWVRATERMIGFAIPRRSVDGFEDVAIDRGPGGRTRSPRGGSGRPRRDDGSGERSRPRGDGRRPRRDGDARREGVRSRGEGDPRREGGRSRRDGDARREGARPRRDGDTRREGARPRRDGDTRREGVRSRGDGDSRREGGRPRRGGEGGEVRTRPRGGRGSRARRSGGRGRASR